MLSRLRWGAPRRALRVCAAPACVYVSPPRVCVRPPSPPPPPGAGRGALVAAGALGLALIAAELFDEYKFFEAARLGDVQELQRQAPALAPGDVDRRHELGWTALMAAAANARAGALRALLALGARPDARDRYPGARALEPGALARREDEFCGAMNARASFLGWTALHYAALADCAECARALLEAGADPTARDHAGRRALHYARDPSELRALLQAGARAWERAAAERAAAERRRHPLEERLKAHLVGQRAAIREVAAAVRRKEAGWHDGEHPLVFLFLGGSGVGKTELAKRLALYLHADEPGAFIRLDMSEYGERHEAAKLIGAPPGYVGHEEGGQLTRALARRPDAVVLLDEVDKAHPDVLAVLLQLFDEGRLTDGKGRLIECRDAVFVMTSNLAADEIAAHAASLRRDQERVAAARSEPARPEPAPQPQPQPPEPAEERVEVSRQFKEQVVRPILKRHFARDEFLGRIDEIVYFLPFSRAELLSLVGGELSRWASRAGVRHGLALRWEGGVLGALADGYEPHYGARSIQHEVQRRVVSRLALAAERGLLPRGAAVLLQAAGGSALSVSVRAPGDQHYTLLDLD